MSGWCRITDQTRPLRPGLVSMRTIGLPRQIVSACVSSAPHVTAATMSESEAQHRLLSPRRMPLAGPSRQRRAPARDTRQSGQQAKTQGRSPEGVQAGTFSTSQGTPSAVIWGCGLEGGSPLVILNTKDPAPINDEAFWRGNLPVPAILFYFFLSSPRFPSRFLVYCNFNSAGVFVSQNGSR